MHFLQVESGDLIVHGLIPEFVGRFQILVSLSSLSEEHLVVVTSLLSKVVLFIQILSVVTLLCCVL
jgi:ATP-dependent protease Clp ATPase subunit